MSDELALTPRVEAWRAAWQSGDAARNRAFPPFSQSGMASAISSASADQSPHGQRKKIMTAFSNYAQHAFAAVSALAISALLFANALATQAAEIHSVVGILA